MAKRKKREETDTGPVIDRVTQYAKKNVVEGRELVGPYIRLACQRHLTDRDRSDLYWNADGANRAIDFFEKVLKLNGGRFEGRDFILQPWQAFIVGSLHGWKLSKDSPELRFQVAYVEAPKGSGKSPLAAGVGLYRLTAVGESRAEVYAAAVKKDQAMILFRDAVAMVNQSPYLKTLLKQSGTGINVWNLYHEATGSFFRPISSDDNSQSGPRPSCALVDEVHEHQSSAVIDMMIQGFKGRLNPLLFMITNSGFDKNSVCYRYHSYSIEVLDRVKQNDRHFAFICSLDEGDDYRDEKVWRKVNLNLDVSVTREYLANRVREAQDMPALESLVRRLNFCEWVEVENRAVSLELWDQGSAPIDVAALKGRPCYGGMDLALVNDLSCFVLLFPPQSPGEKTIVVPHFWIPSDDISVRVRRDGVPYDQWERMGLLTATQGNTTDFSFIRAAIVSLAGQYQIRAIGYDRTFAATLVQELQEELGADRMVQVGQGFLSLGAPTGEFLRLVKAGELQHGGHPVARWCVSNLVLATDPAGNVKPAKDRSADKIDFVSAAVNAIALMQQNVNPVPRSIYEDRGLITLGGDLETSGQGEIYRRMKQGW